MNTVSMFLFFLCANWGGDRYPFAGLAAAGLPLCVMLDSPIWLMAGFSTIPLLASILLAKASRHRS